MSLLASLLSYYPLSANANDVAGSNNLTNVNTVTFSGGAANFVASSTQSLAAASGSVLDFTTGSFSISLWIKTTVSTTEVFLNKALSSSAGYEVYVISGAVGFVIADSGGTHLVSATSTAKVNDDNWHHVVAVCDRTANKLLLYIDGAVQASQPSISAVGSVSDTSFSFFLGRDAGTGFYFTGAIKHVAIASRAYSAVEAAQLFNGGTPLIYPFAFSRRSAGNPRIGSRGVLA